MYLMVIALLCYASQTVADNTVPEVNEMVGVKPDKTDHAPDIDHAEQLFKRLFKKRRAEQLEAVKGLLTMESYEKQFKMVNVIVEKVFSVIQSSRVLLESSGYIPGISSFPKDETVLDALANILENTALFGDILLHLPDISHKVLASKREWQVLLHWSLEFANQTQLLDKHTRAMVDLVNMELNLTSRDPGYVNPYRREGKNRKKEEETTLKSKKKKRKEIKKGPRLSTNEL